MPTRLPHRKVPNSPGALLQAALRLVRWRTTLIACVATATGAGLTASNTTLLISPLVVGLLCSGGFALNDYFDWRIDAVCNPTRPIPSGAIPRRMALVMSMVFFAASLILAGLQGPGATAFAAALIAMLVLYSLTLKRYLLLANLATAAMCASIFAYGATASHRPLHTIAPQLSLTFVFILAREVLLDVLHEPGDRVAKRRTLAIGYSAQAATHVARMLLLLAGAGSVVSILVTGKGALSFGCLAIALTGLALFVPRPPNAVGLRTSLRLSAFIMALAVVLWLKP